MAETHLRVERKPPIVRLTLSHPERRNALSVDMMRRLTDALAAFRMATPKPTRITNPRSISISVAMARGPGVGGTKTWVAAPPAPIARVFKT